MKKTVSIIYKLAFLVLSIWAIFENVTYNLSMLIPSLQNFTIFSNLFFVICMTIAFFSAIQKKSYKWFTYIKGICILLATFLIISNFNQLTNFITIHWILSIFLPTMLILDWLFFDPKGKVRLYDILIWLAGAAAILTAFLFLLNKLFGIKNFLDAAGLSRNIYDLLNYLPYLIGTGFLIYILDNLFSSKKQKNASALLKYLLRIGFIALEIYSFSLLSEKNVSQFLYSLIMYSPLVNFMCLLCISALVFYEFFGTEQKADTVFSRIKALCTISISAVLLIQIFVTKEYHSLSAVVLIHNIIAPIMMLTDLILFDNKKGYKKYDPFVWLIFPLTYYVVNCFFKITTIYPFTTFSYGLGILLVLGYIFLVLGKVKRY